MDKMPIKDRAEKLIKSLLEIDRDFDQLKRFNHNRINGEEIIDVSPNGEFYNAKEVQTLRERRQKAINDYFTER